MTRRAVSYALTIDGCPYAAGSAGAPASITSSDGDWPAGVVVLPGALAHEALARLSWSEDVRPTTGELSVGSISLALEDKIPSSGMHSGVRVWSLLFARRTRSINSAQLASPGITSTDTSIVVAYDPGFSTGSQIIWIDREAILCSGYNAGTKTFSITSRGYLGTRAAAHLTDEANAFAPLAWDEFPNPQRRRSILWMVEDGVATPVWRGYVGRAPRLSSDGARWELQLEHAWTVQAARSLGPARTSTRIVGFQPNSFKVELTQTGFAGATINRFEVRRERLSDVWPESLERLASLLSTELNPMLALSSPAVVGYVRLSVSDGRLRAESNVDVRHQLVVGPRVTMPVLLPDLAYGSDQSVERATGVFSAIATMGYPCSAHNFIAIGEGNEVTLDSVEGIPTTGLVTSSTDGATTTRVQWALQTRDPAAPFHLALTAVDATTRRVSGRAVAGFAAQGGPGTTTLATRNNYLLTEPTDADLITRVESSHWLYALRRGALSPLYGIDDQADPRDWDWDNASAVVGATGGEYSTSRVWIFDGSAKLGDFVKDAVRLDACALGLSGSRLSFGLLDPPLEHEPSAYSIDLTAGEGIHRSVSGYTTQPDGVVNVARITREDAPSLTVNNQQSIALYGLSQPLEVEAKGAVASTVAGLSPFELARGPLSRALGLWGEPTELLSVDAPLDAITGAELLSIVSITSKALPTSAGERGVVSTRRGRVVSRAIDFARGVVRLGVLVFPHRVSAYAPCARVASISGTTVTLDTTYLTSTATDYSASDEQDYTGSTLNDGGCSRFSVGDILRFRLADATSGLEEGGWEVATVTPAGPTLTLTAAPTGGAIDWEAEIAAGNVVEVTFDDYDAGITADQKRWSYVGSRSTRTLDGDPLKEWAP